MKPQYVQYIQYRSVLNAGHALIKTICIETIFACSDIAFTATVIYIQEKLQGQPVQWRKLL